MTLKKIVLVTGANSGIGYATAQALAAASASNHVIMACRRLSRGEKAKRQLEGKHLAGTLSLLELDLTKDETITSAIESIEQQHGKLDVLINNAGTTSTQAEDRRGEINEMIDVNAVGPFILAEACLPLLKNSQNPRIINISSGIGSITERLNPKSESGFIKFERYRMSKAALNMAGACLHAQNQDWGLKVFSFCPGAVDEEGGENGPEKVAEEIVEIAEGKRNDEAGRFWKRYGNTWEW